MAIKFEPKSSEKKKATAAPKASAKPKATAKPKAARKGKAASAAKRSAPKPQQAKPEGKKRGGNSGPDHKGGATPKLTNAALVIEVLRASGGIKAVAAERLNVSRTTLYKFIDGNPEVEEALKEIDNEIVDVAEAQVVQAINKGDMQTVRWFLEMKAKDRGYVRRVENSGPNGGPIPVAQKVDLTQLSDQELEILLKAAEKRESETVGK